MLDRLYIGREGRSRRVSSWDRRGKNRDYWTIRAGDRRVLGDLRGPGIIRHIWFTIDCKDPLYLRKAVLRMYWDGADAPSVEVPVGDFFGVGHAKVASYSSCVLNMSANAGNDRNAAMNCYFPMPFARRARIEVHNECEVPIRAWYFSIDYEEIPALRPDALRFHAQWRRCNPCEPPRVPRGADPEVNLTDRRNYTILEARGAGHYVGCNLSVHNLLGGWWGEGDDMFVIDGRPWPPDLHGTGSEDYFGHAWGMQIDNAYLYNGVSFHSGPDQGINERITVYRYHVVDPVIFARSIRVSIEHGHANDRCDDYASTAYWYQALPQAPFPPLPGVEERLPRPAITVVPADLPVRPRRTPSGTRLDPAQLPRRRR